MQDKIHKKWCKDIQLPIFLWSIVGDWKG